MALTCLVFDQETNSTQMLCAVQARTFSIAAIVPHAATTDQPVKSPVLVSPIALIYLEQDRYPDSCSFLEASWSFLWLAFFCLVSSVNLLVILLVLLLCICFLVVRHFCPSTRVEATFYVIAYGFLQVFTVTMFERV